jgi:hydrogenase expression/formation protein HypC
MCLAVPGKILDVSGDTPLARTARVSFGGVVKQVSLAYVPEAEVGQYVITHVGLALSVVDEAEAERVLGEFAAAGFDLSAGEGAEA